jgi:hypothetical protein
MAIGRRTDPDIGVGGRNGQPPNAEQPGLIADPLAFGVEVLEVLALGFSRITGLVVVDVAQAGIRRDFNRIGRDFDLVDFFLFPAQFGGGHSTNTCAVPIQAVATACCRSKARRSGSSLRYGDRAPSLQEKTMRRSSW